MIPVKKPRESLQMDFLKEFPKELPEGNLQRLIEVIVIEIPSEVFDEFHTRSLPATSGKKMMTVLKNTTRNQEKNRW